jgi:uncharacterized protein
VSGAEPTRLPTLPALVVGRITHRRRGPIRHEFRHRVYQWLVDLDSLPGRRPDRRFRSEDHLGDPKRTIKANVENFLARNGIQLGDDSRVLMLAHARVLGHVFNPLSVFWCYAGATRLAAVVAEVHNTYGERHAYLLRPDETGVAATGKKFHVSPFYGVDGAYELRFTLRDDHVGTAVTLRRNSEVAFVAAFRGRPEPATARAVARMRIRQPLMPHRVSTLIRLHGIWLWLRGLPVQPHPPRILQAGV